MEMLENTVVGLIAFGVVFVVLRLLFKGLGTAADYVEKIKSKYKEQ